MNPAHTIPVMKDGEVILSESRAIICYLADKARDRKLYPKEDKVAKAKVDQRLFFDMATFYQRLGDSMVRTTYLTPFKTQNVHAMVVDPSFSWKHCCSWRKAGAGQGICWLGGRLCQVRWITALNWPKTRLKYLWYGRPTGYVAGTSYLTVADLCLGVTYSQILEIGHVDVSGRAEMNEWLARVKASVPNLEECWNNGEQTLAQYFKAKAADLA